MRTYRDGVGIWIRWIRTEMNFNIQNCHRNAHSIAYQSRNTNERISNTQIDCHTSSVWERQYEYMWASPIYKTQIKILTAQHNRHNRHNNSKSQRKISQSKEPLQINLLLYLIVFFFFLFIFLTFKIFGHSGPLRWDLGRAICHMTGKYNQCKMMTDLRFFEMNNLL